MSTDYIKTPRSMNVMGANLYPKDSINHKEHPDHNKPGFLVRATDKGWYDCALREEGDVFRIQYARHFADTKAASGFGWMEKISEAEAKRPRRRQESDDERGAKPPSRDPEERQQAMAKFDKMVSQIREEEKDGDAN